MSSLNVILSTLLKNEKSFTTRHSGFACVISDFLRLLSIFSHWKMHILIEVSQNITHFWLFLRMWGQILCKEAENWMEKNEENRGFCYLVENAYQFWCRHHTVVCYTSFFAGRSALLDNCIYLLNYIWKKHNLVIFFSRKILKKTTKMKKGRNLWDAANRRGIHSHYQQAILKVCLGK